MNDITPTQWAWIAGLLEGEGCFTISSGYPRIILKMTDKDIVERFANFFGVKVYQRETADPKHKTQWHCQVAKKTLVHNIACHIHEYLGERRRAAIAEWYCLWEDLKLPN